MLSSVFRFAVELGEVTNYNSTILLLGNGICEKY